MRCRQVQWSAGRRVRGLRCRQCAEPGAVKVLAMCRWSMVKSTYGAMHDMSCRQRDEHTDCGRRDDMHRLQQGSVLHSPDEAMLRLQRRPIWPCGGCMVCGYMRSMQQGPIRGSVWIKQCERMLEVPLGVRGCPRWQWLRGICCWYEVCWLCSGLSLVRSHRAMR